MSNRRQVWETLANLLARVEAEMASPSASRADGAALERLEEELRKLGKAQFKANVLAQSESARWEDALATLREEEKQRERILEALITERVAAARRELLETVLPAVDGVDEAMASGRRYLRVRDLAAEKPDLTEEQAILVSPADRAMLGGWLDGLRLVRAHLLGILEAGDVTPIPTVGRPFDPYLHVAVGTTAEADVPPGTIVKEERRGYRTPDSILRYAEVIVHRAELDEGQREPNRTETPEELRSGWRQS
ncbi:MAG: nucleotide exchange factor GrpE [Chloroflexota bacterium]|nr:nucleotide exchange factor GrpE [Chloroflexota bacterium]